MSAYMFQIIVSKDMIAGGDKTNFPLLIDSRIALPIGFWNNVADPNGLDIRFYSDGIKTLEYKREIVQFNTSPNEFESWVQIPNLSSTVDTIIYCEVGAGNMANDHSIWLGYQRLYHMQNNLDSNATFDNLIVSGATLQPGKILKCYDFDGINDHAEVTTNLVFPGVEDELYFSAWIYLRSLLSLEVPNWMFNSGIFSRQNQCQFTVRGWAPFSLSISNDSSISGRLRFTINNNTGCTGGSGTDSYYTNDQLITINAWHRVGVWVENIGINYPSRVVKLYVNGQLAPSNQHHGGDPIDYPDTYQEVGQKTYIGAGYRTGGINFQNFDGLIDEVRLVDNGDSYTDGTLQETEYNNQNDPNSFITVSGFTPIPFNIIYRLKRGGNLDKPDDSLISWLVGSGGHFDGDAPANDYINNHISRALSLIIEQFEESKAILQPLLEIYTKQIQDLENAINSLIFSRNPNSSTGAALDIIGSRVGESRNFRTDDEYRQAIFIRAALNLSSGEPEAVIETLKLVTNAKRVWYSEVKSATIDIEYQSDFLPPIDLIEQLNRVSLGGVQVLAAYVPDGLIFGFDGEGPTSPRENSSGFSEVDYAPGGIELGGKFIEMI